ncbi:hypothetical protein [Brachybacterium huguangmaarense]
MTAATRPPACPSWCDESDVDGHWTKPSDRMPWEVGHVRTFGPLVFVSIGHEIHNDGTERWWSPEVIVRPHRMETAEGSQYTVPQALNLATRLAEAAAFALATRPAV